jgi:FkbM family methyltransferase
MIEGGLVIAAGSYEAFATLVVDAANELSGNYDAFFVFGFKRLRERIKKTAKFWLGSFPPEVDYQCPIERFGSEYGGWDVAVEFVNENSIIYSFGLGDDASFDSALIETFGVMVHAFDPTPRSIEWLAKQSLSPKFQFYDYGLASIDGSLSFNPPEDASWYSYTVLDRPTMAKQAINLPVKRLSTIMRDLGHSKIDVLKMDIEGSEYAVIEDMQRADIYPTQILIEFHHRFPGVGVKKTKKAVSSLRKMGYYLFSVSNTGEDFCFLRKQTTEIAT